VRHTGTTHSRQAKTTAPYSKGEPPAPPFGGEGWHVEQNISKE